MQLAVGEGLPVARLALPDEGALVAAAAQGVAVDAVDAGVDLPADEPLGVGRAPVEHRVPRPAPFELLREAGPEPLRSASARS